MSMSDDQTKKKNAAAPIEVFPFEPRSTIWLDLLKNVVDTGPT